MGLGECTIANALIDAAFWPSERQLRQNASWHPNVRVADNSPRIRQ